jgi:hypothetical protein
MLTEKKPVKRLKTLRLRKEVLKILTKDQLTQVNGGSNTDTWDPGPSINPLKG